jgi:pimeloyl-ACP methyl ester carboxylesterase
VTPLVLVHGGGFDHRCWDLLVPELHAPTLAVDLPGRGAHPADLLEVTLEACARSVVADVDQAGFEEIVLVGHSLAGCSMPATIGLLGERVRHAVFVACTVPADGTSCAAALEVDFLDGAERASDDIGPIDAELARVIFGNDLDDDRFAWMVERMLPEAPRLVTDPVDLAPLRSSMPKTWIRALQDAIVPPDKQLRFAANAGAQVVDLDAAHMCMISQPEATAALLNEIAASA